MRKLVVLLMGAVVLAVVNYSIYQKEQLLANGRTVYLELAPVDPRSMMQGDYLALRFRMQNDIAMNPDLRDGYVVARVDDRGVAAFQSMDNGTPLSARELRLFYRVRAGQVKFGTNAFFFQEGDAGEFAGARYGEARVAQDGQMLLVGLRDDKLQKLGPGR